jgi:hypothetical protein
MVWAGLRTICAFTARGNAASPVHVCKLCHRSVCVNYGAMIIWNAVSTMTMHLRLSAMKNIEELLIISTNKCTKTSLSLFSLLKECPNTYFGNCIAIIRVFL